MTREKAIEVLSRPLYMKSTPQDVLDAHKMAIKILEQASCEDAISRQAVLDLIEHYNSDGLGSVFYGYDEGVKFAKAVNKLPSISPLEPKAGHWQKYKSMIYCSECGASIEAGYLNDMNYCYNCGAEMESEV